MQKEQKSRDVGLKRFWCLPKAISAENSASCNSTSLGSKRSNGAQRFQHLHYIGLSQIGGKSHESGGKTTFKKKTTCSLPLLQIWPSQDSPRGEADGQSFVFSDVSEKNHQIDPDIDIDGEGSISLLPISNNNSNSNGNLDNSNQHLGIHKSLIANDSFYSDSLHAGDSGIESVQLSPSPNAMPPSPVFNHSSLLINITNLPTSFKLLENEGSHAIAQTPTNISTNSLNHTAVDYKQQRSTCLEGSNHRRQSNSLLHPDHARLFALRMKHMAALEMSQTSPDQTSIEDAFEFPNNDMISNLNVCSASSSMNSSLNSVAAVSMGGEGISKQTFSMNTATDTVGNAGISGISSVGVEQQTSEAWLQAQSDRENDSHYERNRSFSMSTRCSLFDALDLEYALLRAAARGSVGPYSLSESIHKLTFTQSLAFPALARGLASKHRRSATKITSRPLNPNESGLSICAKVITAVILVAISFMVFLIVYKFVHT